MRLSFPSQSILPTMLAVVALAGCTDARTASGRLASARANAEPGPTVAGWRASSQASPGAYLDNTDPAETYLLDSGDRLRIFVYGQPNLSRIYPVDQAGTITVPLIGTVRARGLTTSQLERAVSTRLATQYVRDPQVTVDIIQARPFFILGEVRNAGQYPYVSGLTARSAVAIAGGFSERADEQRVQITRRSGGVSDKMDVSDSYTVLPGDTIYVYERYF